MISPPLRIAIQPRDVFTINTSTNGEIVVTGGYEAGLLDTLIRGLGMPYVLSVPSHGTWGVPDKDGNWSGLIGMVQREEVDMAVGSILVSGARMAVVSFSYPYAWRDITFATRLPSYFPKGTAFIWPFECFVWLCLAMYIIAYVVIFRCFLEKKHSWQRLFLHTFGVLLRQPSRLKTTSNKDWILLWSWTISCMFLSFSYTAVLLSFLTVPLREPSLQNVRQLAKAVEAGRYKCATAKGSSILEGLVKSKQEGIRTLGSYIKRNDWFVDVRSKSEVADYLHQKRSALIITRERIKFQFQDQIHLARETLFSVPVSVAVRKKFPYKKKLNKIIKRGTMFGIYDRNINHYLYKKKMRYSHLAEVETNTNSTRKKLALNDLYGAFVFLGFGHAVALSVFIAELYYPMLRRSKKRSKGRIEFTWDKFVKTNYHPNCNVRSKSNQNILLW